MRYRKKREDTRKYIKFFNADSEANIHWIIEIDMRREQPYKFLFFLLCAFDGMKISKKMWN